MKYICWNQNGVCLLLLLLMYYISMKNWKCIRCNERESINAVELGMRRQSLLNESPTMSSKASADASFIAQLGNVEESDVPSIINKISVRVRYNHYGILQKVIIKTDQRKYQTKQTHYIYRKYYFIIRTQ